MSSGLWWLPCGPLMPICHAGSPEPPCRELAKSRHEGLFELDRCSVDPNQQWGHKNHCLPQWRVVSGPLQSLQQPTSYCTSELNFYYTLKWLACYLAIKLNLPHRVDRIGLFRKVSDELLLLLRCLLFFQFLWMMCHHMPPQTWSAPIAELVHFATIMACGWILAFLEQILDACWTHLRPLLLKLAGLLLIIMFPRQINCIITAISSFILSLMRMWDQTQFLLLQELAAYCFGLPSSWWIYQPCLHSHPLEWMAPFPVAVLPQVNSSWSHSHHRDVTPFAPEASRRELLALIHTNNCWE